MTNYRARFSVAAHSLQDMTVVDLTMLINPAHVRGVAMDDIKDIFKEMKKGKTHNGFKVKASIKEC
jgi:hypothetical protein